MNDDRELFEDEPKVLWSMTFSTMDNGARDLTVEGAPSIAEMMAELQTMLENLRAQLFVDKLMMQGKQKYPIIRPGQ